MTEQGWSTQRPGSAAYQQAYDNIGKYTKLTGKPYIDPNVPMFVPAQGENSIRIVEPIELVALQTYYLNIYIHAYLGMNKDYFVCTKYMNNISPLINCQEWIKPCYRCDQLTQDLWDTDKDTAKTYLPSERRLMWVLDLKNPAESNILKLWSCPRSLSDEILSQSHDPDTKVFIDISHPDTGVPIYFRRTGQGLQTTYTSVKLSQRPFPIGIEIARQRKTFKEILIWPLDGEIKASMEFEDAAAAEEEARGPAPPAPDGVTYDSDPALPPQEESTPAPAVDTEPEFDFSELDNVPVDLHDCFRQEFDKYEECDSCSFRVKCQEPWPVKKKEKKEKKTKKTERVKPAEPTQERVTAAAPDESTVNSTKYQSAREKLQAEIESRRKAETKE